MSKPYPPRGLTPWARVEWYGWSIGESGCWEFDGPRTGKGYGAVEIEGRSVLVHRISFAHHREALPDYHHGSPTNTLIRHTCDNPPCMNPDHLIPGSQADNNRDARERGQWYALHGEGHGSAKLSQAEVDSIRAEYKGRGRGPTQVELARRHGVTQGLVTKIINHKIWKENA